MRLQILTLATITLPVVLCPLSGQWINYPTAGVPRTPDGKPNLAAACPRTADGKPDFSGLWIVPTQREPNANFPGCAAVSDEFINLAAHLKGGLPYQPWAAELVKARRSEERVNDPMSRCVPIGPIRLHTWNGPRKVVQAPGLLIIMNELDTTFRQIFTDGRPKLADPNPSWNGYSSGKWEGDTLVVHTNGFRDHMWLDAIGNPMTDAAQITERFRRINFGNLEIEITVDDPGAYAKPWIIKRVSDLDTKDDVGEYVCSENNRDAEHLVGK